MLILLGITNLGVALHDLHQHLVKLDNQLLFLRKHRHHDQNQGHRGHHEHLLPRHEGDHKEGEAIHQATSNRE